MRKLYIFANFGDLKSIPKSGGQSSARRVMDGLGKMGYEVHPIIKHRSELKGKIAHQFEIFFFAFLDLFKICWALLFKKRKNSAFMMLTYAGSLVPFEFVISLFVRCLGFKSIYYLKGGKLLDTYNQGASLYRWLFTHLINWQSLALFEGLDSLELTKTITKTPLAFFPNYVMDNQIKSYEKPSTPIGMLYFGRVTPDKNVHVIIEAFNILCKKYDNLHLTIIGSNTRAVDYTNRIEKMIKESPYKTRIMRLGNSPFEVILDVMKTHHFFIFPSHEKAEGHSNSLNEAMSQGLIPIVSDWHFNRAIVGDDRLVVVGYDPMEYAKRIDGIIMSDQIEKLSEYMQNRIKTNFTEEVVLNNINQALQKLWV